MAGDLCAHFNELAGVAAPRSGVCDQCVVMGDTWVHLRACLGCGQVGCCDNSKNTHARKHWEQDGHALIQSIEPHESWRYCYPDHLVVN